MITFSYLVLSCTYTPVNGTAVQDFIMWK